MPTFPLMKFNYKKSSARQGAMVPETFGLSYLTKEGQALVNQGIKLYDEMYKANGNIKRKSIEEYRLEVKEMRNAGKIDLNLKKAIISEIEQDVLLLRQKNYSDILQKKSTWNLFENAAKNSKALTKIQELRDSWIDDGRGKFAHFSSERLLDIAIDILPGIEECIQSAIEELPNATSQVPQDYINYLNSMQTQIVEEKESLAEAMFYRLKEAREKNSLLWDDDIYSLGQDIVENCNNVQFAKTDLKSFFNYTRPRLQLTQRAFNGFYFYIQQHSDKQKKGRLEIYKWAKEPDYFSVKSDNLVWQVPEKYKQLTPLTPRMPQMLFKGHNARYNFFKDKQYIINAIELISKLELNKTLDIVQLERDSALIEIANIEQVIQQELKTVVSQRLTGIQTYLYSELNELHDQWQKQLKQALQKVALKRIEAIRKIREKLTPRYKTYNDFGIVDKNVSELTAITQAILTWLDKITPSFNQPEIPQKIKNSFISEKRYLLNLISPSVGIIKEDSKANDNAGSTIKIIPEKHNQEKKQAMSVLSALSQRINFDYKYQLNFNNKYSEVMKNIQKVLDKIPQELSLDGDNLIADLENADTWIQIVKNSCLGLEEVFKKEKSNTFFNLITGRNEFLETWKRENITPVIQKLYKRQINLFENLAKKWLAIIKDYPNTVTMLFTNEKYKFLHDFLINLDENIKKHSQDNKDYRTYKKLRQKIRQFEEYRNNLSKIDIKKDREKWFEIYSNIIKQFNHEELAQEKLSALNKIQKILNAKEELELNFLSLMQETEIAFGKDTIEKRRVLKYAIEAVGIDKKEADKILFKENMSSLMPLFTIIEKYHPKLAWKLMQKEHEKLKEILQQNKLSPENNAFINALKYIRKLCASESSVLLSNAQQKQLDSLLKSVENSFDEILATDKSFAALCNDNDIYRNKLVALIDTTLSNNPVKKRFYEKVRNTFILRQKVEQEKNIPESSKLSLVKNSILTTQHATTKEKTCETTTKEKTCEKLSLLLLENTIFQLYSLSFEELEARLSFSPKYYIELHKFAQDNINKEFLDKLNSKLKAHFVANLKQNKDIPVKKLNKIETFIEFLSYCKIFNVSILENKPKECLYDLIKEQLELIKQPKFTILPQHTGV